MEKSVHLSNITLKDFLSIVFRKKMVVLVTIVIILTAAFIMLKMSTPVYQATVKMYISGQRQVVAETYYGIGARSIHFTQMAIVKSKPVYDRTIKALKLDERPLDYEKQFCSPLKKPIVDYFVKMKMEELDNISDEERAEFNYERALKFLRENVTTELIRHTDIFTITVTDYSVEEAKKIANVISRAYTIYDQVQQLAELKQRYGAMHPSVRQLRDNIRYSTGNLSGDKLSDLEAIGTASVKIIEQATSTGKPVGKSKAVSFVTAGFVALFLGLALALMFDFLGQTIKSPNDIVKYLRLPVIGSLTKQKLFGHSLLKKGYRKNRYAQLYEEVAVQLYVFLKTQKMKSILLISNQSSHLNKYISSNIAYCLSDNMDCKTLLVEANLKTPFMGKLLGANDNKGLVGLLEAPESTDIITKVNDNVDFIQSGKTDLSPVVFWDNFDIKSLFHKFKEEYDVVIYDGTNIRNYNDNALMYPHIDGIVYIVNQGIDKHAVIRDKINTLKNLDVRFVGCVLNNRKFEIPGFIYKRL